SNHWLRSVAHASSHATHVALTWTLCPSCFFCIFFNDTATTEIYTLSLHDALPICQGVGVLGAEGAEGGWFAHVRSDLAGAGERRSEEHTSELQSHLNLVCRLLLEKKKKKITTSSLTEHTHE